MVRPGELGERVASPQGPAHTEDIPRCSLQPGRPDTQPGQKAQGAQTPDWGATGVREGAGGGADTAHPQQWVDRRMHTALPGDSAFRALSPTRALAHRELHRLRVYH